MKISRPLAGLRRWLAMAVVVAIGFANPASSASPAQLTVMPNPAALGALGSSLTHAPDGTIYLSWLEPVGNETWALKFSRLDQKNSRWGEARTIAQGADWFINWADFPSLAAQIDRLTAVWFVKNPAHGHQGHHGSTYRAWHSNSLDQGESWTEPQPITQESDSVEFVTMQPLPDGHLLAAWLDGRMRAQGREEQQLYARILGASGPDMLVDDLVCDCCQLSMVTTAGGATWLAYRGRTKEEVRDMRLVRFDGNSWSQPQPLNADGWKITACPVNGPQLAQRGDLLGAVWFTSSNETPQVLARVSHDAGKSFFPTVRVDLGKPMGRVDSALLVDGTLVICWLELTGDAKNQEGGIYLRKLSAAGILSKPQLVAASRTSRLSGFPRIIERGDSQVMISYTEDIKPTRVMTLTVDLK